jgi:hypothetical protein
MFDGEPAVKVVCMGKTSESTAPCVKITIFVPYFGLMQRLRIQFEDETSGSDM